MEPFLDYLIHRFIDNSSMLSGVVLGIVTYLYLKITTRRSPTKKKTIYRNLKCIIIRQLRIFLGDDWVKIDKQLRKGLLVFPIILGGLLHLPFVNTNFILASLHCWFFIILSGPGIKPKLNNWEIIKSVFKEYKLLVFLYMCSALCFIWSSGCFNSSLLCFLIAMIVIVGVVCFLAMLPRIIMRILRPFVKLIYKDESFRKAVLAASLGGLIFILQ